MIKNWKKILTSTVILTCLTGCSTHQWWPGIDSRELCDNLRKNPGFKPDGHINTTHIISHIAHVDPETSERYALFSQVPDAQWFRFSAPAVSVWGVPWWGGYRHEINAILHSLHGGGSEQIDNRRRKLAELIRKYHGLNARENDWKVGLLIHALGDSYAHVYSMDGGSEKAYGPSFGHLNEKGNYSPDSIQENFANYTQFTQALFESLAGNDKQKYIEDYDGYIDALNSIVKESNKISKKDRDGYVGREIAKVNNGIAPIQFACEHESWVKNEISRENVSDFLKSIREILESES